MDASPPFFGLKVFQDLGLLLVEGFLGPLCSQLANDMRSPIAESKASVYYKGTRGVDEVKRKTSMVRVAPDRATQIQAKLEEMRPAVSRHFATDLHGLETPQFLRYRKGDFFSKHSDSGEDKYKNRRVSIVIFLNDASPTAAGFSGGDLQLYGLLKGPHFERLGLPLRPRADLLVAFPSHLIHEVTAVTQGERLSVVSWYTL